MANVVYTDGSGMRAHVGGWAWVCPATGRYDSGAMRDTDSFKMEAYAIYAAVLANPGELVIVSDHLGLVRFLQQPPRLHNPSPRLKDLAQAWRAREGEVTAEHCRGHDGVAGNEWADRLAGAAAARLLELVAPAPQPVFGGMTPDVADF